MELRRYPSSHPFAQLQGSDNIIAFTTQRYNQQPLIIRYATHRSQYSTNAAFTVVTGNTCMQFPGHCIWGASAGWVQGSSIALPRPHAVGVLGLAEYRAVALLFPDQMPVERAGRKGFLHVNSSAGIDGSPTEHAAGAGGLAQVLR